MVIPFAKFLKCHDLCFCLYICIVVPVVTDESHTIGFCFYNPFFCSYKIVLALPVTVGNIAIKGLRRTILSAATKLNSGDELRILLKPFLAILRVTALPFLLVDYIVIFYRDIHFQHNKFPDNFRYRYGFFYFLIG